MEVIMVKAETATPEKRKRGRPKGSKNKPKIISAPINPPQRNIVLSRPRSAPIDPLQSLKNEINEAIELQRPHFPNDDEATLRFRAERFRSRRYKEGRWPNFAEVAKREGVASPSDHATAPDPVFPEK
jgi:hypothetical protein